MKNMPNTLDRYYAQLMAVQTPSTWFPWKAFFCFQMQRSLPSWRKNLYATVPELPLHSDVEEQRGKSSDNSKSRISYPHLGEFAVKLDVLIKVCFFFRTYYMKYIFNVEIHDCNIFETWSVNVKLEGISCATYKNTLFLRKISALAFHQIMPKYALQKPSTNSFHQLQRPYIVENLALITFLATIKSYSFSPLSISECVFAWYIGPKLGALSWINAQNRGT